MRIALTIAVLLSARLDVGRTYSDRNLKTSAMLTTHPIRRVVS